MSGALFVGVATLDVIQQVLRAPGPNEKVSSTGRLVCAGGPATNAAVTCAIPGSTQPAHVEDNLGAARGRLPDAAQRQAIARYFDAIADN